MKIVEQSILNAMALKADKKLLVNFDAPTVVTKVFAKNKDEARSQFEWPEPFRSTETPYLLAFKTLSKKTSNCDALMQLWLRNCCLRDVKSVLSVSSTGPSM